MIGSIGQEIGLNNGRQMPGYGFGLYKSAGRELVNAIGDAYACGYRLYDTAAFYKNEEATGEALAAYPRKETFIISKIWPTSFDQPVKALDKSLRELGVDYLDAYLLHWPGTNHKAMLDTWEILSREREKGKILSLGVSNFLRQHLEAIFGAFQVWPPVNQMEIQPFYQQVELCEFCAAHAIAVMAWSPIGRGRALDNPVIKAMAKEIGKSEAQVILRWHIQQNRIPLPKSVHARRIRENADVFSFSLSASQMAQINGLDRGIEGRAGADPLTFAG